MMAMKTTTAESKAQRNVSTVQNFHLIWLDARIDEINNDDCRKSIRKLRQVVNTVNTFTNPEECIQFINDKTKQQTTFMISSGAFGETIVPEVHDKPHVNTIYIFCGDKTRHEKWSKKWSKIGGVYTDIGPICQALKQATRDSDHNSLSISVVKPSSDATNQNLDTLDPSFMYSQILKDILFTITFEPKDIDRFISFCRNEFNGNSKEMENIDKIEKEYRDHSPIWWYTCECFLYSTLNRALRTMEIDLIIKMGFFVQDLHNHIVKLHTEQFSGQSQSDSFTVYRGQGLSQTDFNQLSKAQGGLLSFNNFLSTSMKRDVPMEFAGRAIKSSNLIGILFVLKINPAISATPFANVKDVSYFKKEEEILFSMHSIFRIGEMKPMDSSKRLWQVDLTLTNDNDPQLHLLTEYMRKQIKESKKMNGWYRLEQFLIQLGQFNKAEELCTTLLEEVSSEREKGFLFHELGWIKDSQAKYAEAIEFYEKGLEIEQKILSPDHPSIGTSYNNIGMVYYNTHEYLKALSCFHKSIEIGKKQDPPDHLALATRYNNVGITCCEIDKLSEALECFGKTLKIRLQRLPANHPLLGTTYNNIGSVYKTAGEYSKALTYVKKDLEICEKTLPPDHPDLAIAYNNIGYLYAELKKYSEAHQYFERALKIWQKSFPSNHPKIQQLEKAIESVKQQL